MVKRSTFVEGEELGQGGINRQSTDDFKGNIKSTGENTLYDIIIIDTCHYTCVQMHRMYTIKSEP